MIKSALYSLFLVLLYLSLILHSTPQPSLARPSCRNQKGKVWQDQWKEKTHTSRGTFLPFPNWKNLNPKLWMCIIIFWKVLCKSFPPEFTSYFLYVRSLRFEDKPDYSYLKRLFRDLFIREGLNLLILMYVCLQKITQRNCLWFLLVQVISLTMYSIGLS